MGLSNRSLYRVVVSIHFRLPGVYSMVKMVIVLAVSLIIKIPLVFLLPLLLIFNDGAVVKTQISLLVQLTFIKGMQGLL